MEKNYSVSFVMPMYNEEENISSTIGAIRSFANDITDNYEIVVVDDASTDNSARIVKSISEADDCVKLYCLKENTKFGGAFAKGFKSAEKDIIVYMDSDLPVSREDIKASFPLIEHVDIVTGCSKIKKGDNLKRKILSEFYNFLVQSLFGLDIKDINSGYKIVRREVIKDLDFISRSPFVDVEIFLEAKKNNCSVKQYPLIFRSRSGGESYISRFPIIIATFWDMIRVKIESLKG